MTSLFVERAGEAMAAAMARKEELEWERLFSKPIRIIFYAFT